MCVRNSSFLFLTFPAGQPDWWIMRSPWNHTPPNGVYIYIKLYVTHSYLYSRCWLCLRHPERAPGPKHFHSNCLSAVVAAEAAVQFFSGIFHISLFSCDGLVLSPTVPSFFFVRIEWSKPVCFLFFHSASIKVLTARLVEGGGQSSIRKPKGDQMGRRSERATFQRPANGLDLIGVRALLPAIFALLLITAWKTVGRRFHAA